MCLTLAVHTFLQMFKRIFYTQCQVRRLTTSCIKRNIFKDIKTLQPLQQYAPTFYTHGQHVKPLYQPSAFYAELKSRILSAKERVFIAALYIGHSEKELVKYCLYIHTIDTLTLFLGGYNKNSTFAIFYSTSSYTH